MAEVCGLSGGGVRVIGREWRCQWKRIGLRVRRRVWGEAAAWVAGGMGVPDRSEQEFVRVGYEIEEGMEIGLVFPFIQPVEVGSLFRAGLILFFLFDE
jgi:hypothetical protein